MASCIIEELYLYPIKSMAGVKVDTVEFGPFGPIDDRKYMPVDANHRFITQRTHSVLSQFRLQNSVNGWQVTSPSGESILIFSESDSDDIIETSVWKSNIKAREVSREVSLWFSKQLDELVFLVEFDDLEIRFRTVLDHKAPLRFADGYPLLICNSKSLEALNQRVNVPLAMARFRPNVVVGLPAETEYEVQKLVKGDGVMLLAEPCVRCNVPAIDPMTSVLQRDLHNQLKIELARDNKTVFGMNSIVIGLSYLKVGDEFTIE